ncbi:MAG: hypothetical protein ACLQJR_10975 [Stellaceae bacterium]
MPMIWTAGNVFFLVCVGAAIAFLVASEILEARRARIRARQALPANDTAPTRREPRRTGRLPAAALRRMGLD